MLKNVNKVVSFVDSYMTSYIHHVVIKVINLPTRLPLDGIVVVLRPWVAIKQFLVIFAISYCDENRARRKMNTWSKHGVEI